MIDEDISSGHTVTLVYNVYTRNCSGHLVQHTLC